jgi:hypothetical protein
MTALLCPDCDTSIAVRAAVLAGPFWENLLLVALPLLVLAAIVALFHLTGPAREEST